MGPRLYKDIENHICDYRKNDRTNGRRGKKEKMGSWGTGKMYNIRTETQCYIYNDYMLIKNRVFPINTTPPPVLCPLPVKEDIFVRNMEILKVRFVAAKSWSELCVVPHVCHEGRL